MLPIIASVVLL